MTPTVFSWNINVSGKAKARKIMLETVISRINPDVMLLQETLRSIKGFFKDAGIPKKDYNYEEAQDKKETRMIFKNSAFEKVNPSPVDPDEEEEEEEEDEDDEE